MRRRIDHIQGKLSELDRGQTDRVPKQLIYSFCSAVWISPLFEPTPGAHNSIHTPLHSLSYITRHTYKKRQKIKKSGLLKSSLRNDEKMRRLSLLPTGISFFRFFFSFVGLP